MENTNVHGQDGHGRVFAELSRRAFVAGAAAVAVGALAGCSGSSDGSSSSKGFGSLFSSSYDSEEGIAEVISNMTLEQKISQLFVVHSEQLVDLDAVIQAGDATQQALIADPVAGVVYESKNIVDSTQLTELLNGFYQMDLQASALPPLLLVEEEGGAFAPLANAQVLGLDPVPAACALGESGDLDGATAAAGQVARSLAGFGFNGNLAPVCNLASGKGSLMDERCFSSDAEVVADMVVAQIDTSAQMGIATCAKYFPLANVSSDESRYENLTLESLEKRELTVFQAAIDAEVPMVMMSKVSIPQVLENDDPAVFSEFLAKDMLREQLGFEGVVASCELYSLSADGEFSEEEIGVRALQAGCDLLLLPADYHAMYQGVLDAVLNGSLSEEQITESALRIARLKMNYLAF